MGPEKEPIYELVPLEQLEFDEEIDPDTGEITLDLPPIAKEELAKQKSEQPEIEPVVVSQEDSMDEIKERLREKGTTPPPHWSDN